MLYALLLSWRTAPDGDPSLAIRVNVGLASGTELVVVDVSIVRVESGSVDVVRVVSETVIDSIELVKVDVKSTDVAVTVASIVSVEAMSVAVVDNETE